MMDVPIKDGRRWRNGDWQTETTDAHSHWCDWWRSGDLIRLMERVPSPVP